jgi:putative ATP-binding cassette transporter
MNVKAKSTKIDNTEELSQLVETDTLPNLSTDEITKLRRHALMRRFWRSASNYWKDDSGRRARVLTATLVIIILLSLATSYAMNLWNRAIFDALQNLNGAAVLRLSMLYLLLLVASVVVAIALVFARMTMQRGWRAWLTDHLFDRWLQHGRYYQLNLISGDHQNPEYRIADDVRVATEAPIDFATGVLTATLSAITFIVVLWTIGGALTVQISSHTVTIPGFLVIAAVLYAVIASASMVLIGRRFVTASENKNQSEAEFRYARSLACGRTAKVSRYLAGRRRSVTASTRRSPRCCVAGATSASKPCVRLLFRKPATTFLASCPFSCARPNFSMAR